MANTSSRTLRLLSLLQTHRHWPGMELADRLGVSERRDWPSQALGNIGAEFEVLGPPEFATHVHDWGARFVRATSAPGDRTCRSQIATMARRP